MSAVEMSRWCVKWGGGQISALVSKNKCEERLPIKGGEDGGVYVTYSGLIIAFRRYFYIGEVFTS